MMSDMATTTKQLLSDLTETLRAAQAAATRASQCEDSGTCNLDSVVLRLPRVRKAAVIEAAAAAGVSASETSWLGSGFFLNFDVPGQASRREAGMRAAMAVLTARGFEADYRRSWLFHLRVDARAQEARD